MYSSWAGQEITEKERKREIHACYHLASSIDLRASGASISVRRKKDILGLTVLQIVQEKCLHVGAKHGKNLTTRVHQHSAAQHPSVGSQTVMPHFRCALPVGSQTVIPHIR